MSTRGSFDDECWHPTQFTAWLFLPGAAMPTPFDTIQEALEVLALEVWYQAPSEQDEGLSWK